MDELYKIVLTSALTIIGGVLVYTMGQIISKFYIEPVNDLQRTIGKTCYSLIYYANIYTNPKVEQDVMREETADQLRQLASELIAKSHAVKWVFKVPKKDAIIKASKGLIFLSNTVYDGNATENHKKRKEIEELLNIQRYKK